MLRTGRTGKKGTAGTGGTASGVTGGERETAEPPEGRALPGLIWTGGAVWGGAECQAQLRHPPFPQYPQYTPQADPRRWEFVPSDTNCHSELASHF